MQICLAAYLLTCLPLFSASIQIQGPALSPLISSGGDFVWVKTNSAAGSSSDATTMTVQLTGVTAGNLIVLYVKHEATATTITASDGTSSFSLGTIVTHGNNDLNGRMLYLLSSVASGTVTYTVSFGGGGRPYSEVHAWEFSYTGTAVLDVEPTGGGSSGTSTSASSGNFTTTGTHELCLAGYGKYTGTSTSAQTINNTAGTHIVEGDNGCQSWEHTFTSTFTEDAATTLSGSGEWIINAISFKTQ